MQRGIIDHLEKANACFAAKSWREAIVHYSAVLKVREMKAHSHLWYNLGLCFLRIGESETALKIAEKLQLMKPQWPAAQLLAKDARRQLAGAALSPAPSPALMDQSFTENSLYRNSLSENSPVSPPNEAQVEVSSGKLEHVSELEFASGLKSEEVEDVNSEHEIDEENDTENNSKIEDSVAQALVAEPRSADLAASGTDLEQEAAPGPEVDPESVAEPEAATAPADEEAFHALDARCRRISATVAKALAEIGREERERELEARLESENRETEQRLRLEAQAMAFALEQTALQERLARHAEQEASAEREERRSRRTAAEQAHSMQEMARIEQMAQNRHRVERRQALARQVSALVPTPVAEVESPSIVPELPGSPVEIAGEVGLISPGEESSLFELDWSIA